MAFPSVSLPFLSLSFLWTGIFLGLKFWITWVASWFNWGSWRSTGGSLYRFCISFLDITTKAIPIASWEPLTFLESGTVFWLPQFRHLHCYLFLFYFLSSPLSLLLPVHAPPLLPSCSSIPLWLLLFSNSVGLLYSSLIMFRYGIEFRISPILLAWGGVLFCQKFFRIQWEDHVGFCLFDIVYIMD